ncbi:molybdenum cofactor biosynthesis protein B [Halomonas sp. ISL-60]|uniref:molybdenum cofactor biosynthesis protein B n=1 Tax=Halomonas sp. ISL-56 TaxID=2819149 RepID=UPI001BEBBD35|nr:molybdenum cofactor biosynthesis protein B [Halomonas sp. ISL-56]MBT2771141.1 molybdenum cofactor biosynthesis protein B [Halomonas sp. ISL-60]MBT2802212.1 molybdenum cofactor biosynthesis protein B [Halomonas sp. ISL-56]
MSHVSIDALFAPLGIAVLTVSDTRGFDEDGSGDLLVKHLNESGHVLVERRIVVDDIYQVRAVVSEWIARADIHAILVNGGTGFTTRDTTPEALIPLFDKAIEGYGELFRHYSLKAIGTATIQSRAVAGVANQTMVFAMPGSPKACALAWDRIISLQLDARTRPCNFAAMVLPSVTPCSGRHEASLSSEVERL